MSQSTKGRRLEEIQIILEIQVYCSWFQLFGCVAVSTYATCWQFVVHFPDPLTLSVEEEVALQNLSSEVYAAGLTLHLPLPFKPLYCFSFSEFHDLARW